jgi:sterol desaturase/sphingolipid hydroxylase (fatty acid hydroxylase superfamily)
MIDLIRDAWHEILVFFRIEGLINILQEGNYRALATIDGFLAFISPLAPIIIFFEILWLFSFHKFEKKSYKISFLIIVLNRVLSRLLGVSLVVVCIGIFQKYAIIETSLRWYWFIYGYFVYELNSFIRHYSAHKVRFLWCFHSVHHSPESLNASITLTTSYIENLYTDFFAATFCMILGLQPIVFFTVMIFDSIWGAFVHISEKTLKNGRLGFLEKYILTPSHHRVHHAKNELYMDTNFCSIINVWDRIFGTYQAEMPEVKVSYGTTRKQNSTNFVDVYFGEMKDLWQDVKTAPSLKDKILYIFMPPGWKHTGNHQTAKILRDNYRKNYKF